jgi:hypothetical protein
MSDKLSKKTYSHLIFEHRGQPLLPRDIFLRRMVYIAFISILILGTWVLAGMIGYHILAGLSWVDSFLNTAMIVGGMGPVDMLKTSSAKIFAVFYAIFSGVMFLTAFSLMAAPIFHRFLHKFHLANPDKIEKGKPA